MCAAAAAALALGGVASQALADDEAAPAPAAPPVVVEKVTEEPKVYEFPKGRSQDTRGPSRDQDINSPSCVCADWGIQGDYYTDAAKVVATCASRPRWTKTTRTWRSVAEGGAPLPPMPPPPPSPLPHHPLLLANAVGSPRVRRLSART